MTSEIYIINTIPLYLYATDLFMNISVRSCEVIDLSSLRVSILLLLVLLSLLLLLQMFVMPIMSLDLRCQNVFSRPFSTIPNANASNYRPITSTIEWGVISHKGTKYQVSSSCQLSAARVLMVIKA